MNSSASSDDSDNAIGFPVLRLSAGTSVSFVGDGLTSPGVLLGHRLVDTRTVKFLQPLASVLQRHLCNGSLGALCSLWEGSKSRADFSVDSGCPYVCDRSRLLLREKEKERT